MRLQDSLVESVNVNGKTYKLKTDFRDVLRMFDALKNPSYTAEARIWCAVSAVVEKPPKGVPDQLACLAAAKAALIPEEKAGKKGERVTDFDQDADMIRAAFRQAYGIDLYRQKLHWTEFTELLNNLPEGTRYASIIDIRSRPLPELTKWNYKQRQALIEAKAKYAIKKSEAEIQNNFRQSLNQVANSLLAMARKGSDQS